MTQSDWERVQHCFLEAVEMPPRERAPFLNSFPADVRAEVEQLLAHDGPGNNLMSSIVSAAAAERPWHDGIEPGTAIGAFRVVREAGRGGMGTVYEAVREDGQFEQRVAIKVVAGGPASEPLIERFRRERQMLAGLEHPNIARLLDGGTTARGLPYFAMEYIEGVSLVEYCQELPVNRKLELFLQVCAAVDYAHQRLVIHRDLKPHNVLVTKSGAPKLLDFGIAKLVDENNAGVPRFTGAATPHYASPEQLRGEDVTTASDVYSLGALLYELLFGVPPAKAASVELPKVPRDLEAIARRALRVEARERYGSAAAMADDLRRFLDCRPLKARERDARERALKFMRRNRTSTVVAMALALLAIAGAAAAMREYRRAQMEAERARNMLTETLTLSSGPVSDVYQQMERLSQAASARKELAVATVEFLEKLAEQAGSDMRLRVALARAYLRLGDVQGNFDQSNIGDNAGALKSYRAGAKLLEPLPAEGAGPRELLPLWIDLQANIGKQLTDRQDTAGAVTVLSGALRRSAGFPATRSGDVAALRSRANLSLYLARAVFTSDLDGALRYSNDYLAAVKELAARFPGQAGVRYDESIAENQVAFVLTNQGDLEPAAEHTARLIELRELLAKEFPQDVVYRRALELAYEHMAGLQGSPLSNNLGRPDLARIYYEKARPLEASIYQTEHSSAVDHARFLLKAALVDPPSGQVRESLRALREAAESFEQFLAADAGARRYENYAIVAHQQLGLRLTTLEQYGQALAEFRRARAEAISMLQANPADREALSYALDAEKGLAKAMALTGDRTGAEEMAHQAVRRAEDGAQYEKDGGLRKSYLAQAYATQAWVLENIGERAAARESAERAIAQAKPLLTGRARDGNAAVVRQAEAVLAK